ncbi:4561_t:CDS:1, partial [Gigaspora margarita]
EVLVNNKTLVKEKQIHFKNDKITQLQNDFKMTPRQLQDNSDQEKEKY